MAVDQPPVEADLTGFGNDAAAEPDPTEFWRQLWPWDDLNAKSPPARWQQLQRDVMPVLAALSVVRSPTGPRLLAADAVGALRASAITAFADQTVQAQSAGDTEVRVADGTFYTPGMYLLFMNFGDGPGEGGDFVCALTGSPLKVFGVTQWLLPIRPAVVSPLPSGTPFIAFAAPHNRLSVPPWERPNQPPSLQSKVGAGTISLIGAQAGTKLWLHRMHWSCTVAVAGSSCQLQDTTGAVYDEFQTNAVGQLFVEYGGQPVPREIGRAHV